MEDLKTLQWDAERRLFTLDLGANEGWPQKVQFEDGTVITARGPASFDLELYYGEHTPMWIVFPKGGNDYTQEWLTFMLYALDLE